MVKTHKKIMIFIALIVFISFMFSNVVLALGNPDFYDPTPSIEGGGSFIDKAEGILGWIQLIGILISVITIAIIGLKYMFSSVEGKAEYKKTMIPYVLGCFLLVGISIIIELIERLAKF